MKSPERSTFRFPPSSIVIENIRHTSSGESWKDAEHSVIRNRPAGSGSALPRSTLNGSPFFGRRSVHMLPVERFQRPSGGVTGSASPMKRHAPMSIGSTAIRPPLTPAPDAENYSRFWGRSGDRLNDREERCAGRNECRRTGVDVAKEG